MTLVALGEQFSVSPQPPPPLNLAEAIADIKANCDLKGRYENRRPGRDCAVTEAEYNNAQQLETRLISACWGQLERQAAANLVAEEQEIKAYLAPRCTGSTEEELARAVRLIAAQTDVGGRLRLIRTSGIGVGSTAISYLLSVGGQVLADMAAKAAKGAKTV